MTDQLYRKETDEHGNEKFISAGNSIFYGEPKEGIWMISKVPYGRRSSWLAKKIENLPEAMRLAQMEPYRAEIARRLAEKAERIDNDGYLAFGGLSINSIIEIVFDVVKKGKE